MRAFLGQHLPLTTFIRDCHITRLTATIPVLTSSSDPVLDRLPLALVSGLQLAHQRKIKISRGDAIVDPGRPRNAIYFISEGWAISKLSIATGNTQIVDILGPGSIAELTSLNDQSAEGYSTVALQNIFVYRIEIDTLLRLCAKDEALTAWLFETLASHTRRAYRHLTALGQLSARQRLAFAMLKMIDVAEQTDPSSIGKTVHLPMTQEEIGNMLGLTNVSISKLMSAFRKEGLIDYARNRIIVHDAAALSQICGMRLESDYTDAEPTRLVANL